MIVCVGHMLKICVSLSFEQLPPEISRQ